MTSGNRCRRIGTTPERLSKENAMPKVESTPLGAPIWLDLFTSDTDGATAFYGELFGWSALSSGLDYGGYLNYTKDGQIVAGGMHNDGSFGLSDGWSVYLNTDDAEATVDAAVARGGQVLAPVMQVMSLGSMAQLVDVGGARIGMWQPGDHRGFQVWGEPGTPAWFELHTRSYDDSLGFYRDVFGWTTQPVSDTPEFRYSTFTVGETPLAGVMDAAAFIHDGVPSAWSIYFAVGNTDASSASVVALGGAVVEAAQDTPHGRMATVTDPTGAMFRLISQP
jgi:predicted enzyme related to lactoylglutathione lyase